MAHWLKHYEAWQNSWQPASQIWITGSDINACLTLTNTNCCYRHHYSVQRCRYCNEFEIVYVHGSISGWTVSGPKMKSLYHCQYLSPPTSTHGNYPGTASNPIRAYRPNGRQCRRWADLDFLAFCVLEETTRMTADDQDDDGAERPRLPRAVMDRGSSPWPRTDHSGGC